MKKPLTYEDIEERASLDGRVAFAIAAFAVMAASIALLDRIGVDDRLIGRLASTLALGGLATIGILLGSMRVSRFYAGSRAVPPPYGGLALAALAMGLYVPFAPPAAAGAPLSALLEGFGGGILVAALVTGPLLRKTGAFSLPDLLSARYPSLALRLATIIVIGAVALLVGVAGFASAAHLLSLVTGADPRLAIVLIGCVLLCVTVPGGMSGLVWSAAAAGGILFVGLVLPIAVLAATGATLPVPVLGDSLLWQQAVAQVLTWQAPATAQPHGDWVLAAATAIGIGTLAPLLGPAVASPNGAAARRAGTVGVAWTLAIAAAAAATMAVATLMIDTHLVGLPLESVPDFIYTASQNGLVTLCGSAVADVASAKAACGQTLGAAAVLRPQDVAPSGTYLILGMVRLSGSSLALTGLLGSGLVAVSLVLSASGFQALATTLAHDAFYRVHDTSALTSRRLALTRLALIGLVVACAGVLAIQAVDPRAMIGLAIAFSAAAIAPLIALSLWPRADGIDATVALLTGLATAEATIVTAAATPSIERLATSALLACGVGILAGFVASLLHRSNAVRERGAFVHDKGA